MTARANPSTGRWQLWAFLVAAPVAVIVGTIANGLFGDQWFFNADNVVDALPLAVPFLIGVGVITGQDRWRSGRSWLVAGAWLLALDGALAVLLEIEVAMFMNDLAPVPNQSPWSILRGFATQFAQILGFASLAAGLWLTRPTRWGGTRRAVWIALAVVLAVAAAGPFAAVNLASSLGDPGDPSLALVMLGQVTFALGLLALAALAVAAVRAAPPLRPLPELIIGAGAAVSTLAAGTAWWAFYTAPDITALGALLAVAQLGLLVVAAGFASGALFWPAEE
jgi:hypothetical protein